MTAHRAEFLARVGDASDCASAYETLYGSARDASAADGADVKFGLADGIGPEEAEAIALVYNVDLRAARLKLGVTRAGAEYAGLWDDPALGVDLTRIIESSANPWKTGIGLSLTVPISGRLEIEKARAGAEHAVGLAEAAAAEWRVRHDVRRAWTEWSVLAHEIVVAQEFLGRIEQVLKIVDAMEQVGEIARTEARLFRVELASTQAEVASIESRERAADLAVRRLMGIPPDAPIKLTPGTLGAMGPHSGEPAAESHPVVQVALAAYEVAERRLQLEVRKQVPDLEIGPGVGREDGDNQISLGVSLPLPLWNANKRAIAEATAEREVARAEVEAAAESLIAEQARAMTGSLAATARRRSLETGLIPLVDAQYADVREVARLGEVNTLLILESLTRQYEAKSKLIAAMRDEAVASITVHETHAAQRTAAKQVQP